MDNRFWLQQSSFKYFQFDFWRQMQLFKEVSQIFSKVSCHFKLVIKVMANSPVDLRRLNFCNYFSLSYTKWAYRILCLKLTEIALLKTTKDNFSY